MPKKHNFAFYVYSVVNMNFIPQVKFSAVTITIMSKLRVRDDDAWA